LNLIDLEVIRMEEVKLTVQAEEIEQVEEINVTPLLPLPVRVLKSFETVPEAEFWPSEITTVVTALMAPQTFKEFNEFINSTTSNNVNNMEKNIQSYRKDYRGYLTDLDKTPNVFSFDVDYI
jgi:hypothetical protein